MCCFQLLNDTRVQFIFQRYHITWENLCVVEKKLNHAVVFEDAKLLLAREKNTARKTELASTRSQERATRKVVNIATSKYLKL